MGPKRKLILMGNKEAKATTAPTTLADRPNWPPIGPLRDPEDLFLREALLGQIFLISGLWTSNLCKKYTSFLSTLPLTTTPGKPKKGEAIRVNDRFQIDDPEFAKALWEQTALQGLVHGYQDPEADLSVPTTGPKQPWGGEVLGLNPNIRIYRYRKGQFFGKHYDESNNLTVSSDPQIPARTTWTLLLYLSSCVGGETIFFPEAPRGQQPLTPVSFSPEIGLALLHRHGADCMLHEGREVLDGEKWVLRSDLCVRR